MRTMGKINNPSKGHIKMQKRVKTKRKPLSADLLRDVQDKQKKAHRAIVAYVNSEIALWNDPPSPAIAHSAIARFFLYNQVAAQKRIDAWVDGALEKFNSDNTP